MSKRSKIITVILGLLLLSIIYPILMGCLYGTPSADDFTNSLGWQNYEGRHIKYLFSNLVNIYKTWQGTYLGVFICGFPIYYYWGLIGLRAWLFGVAVLFFAAVFLTGISFTNWLRIERVSKRVTVLIILLLFLFYVLGTNNLDEIFYWYTGTCVYTLPICFMLFCISFYMLYETGGKRLFLILGIVFGFLAAGGSLDIAALLCSMLLFGILYNYIVLKKISKSFWIGLTALAGAIINVAAPGNYVRHGDGKITLLSSLGSALLRVNSVISFELRSGLLLVIIVVSFVAAFMKLEKDVHIFKYPGLVTLYCYAAILMTDFPVDLGYSNSYFPSRCAFVEHIAIAVYAILVSVYWAGWAKNKEIFRFTREMYLILAIVCIIPLSVYFDVYSLRELTPYKMIWHLSKGDYRIAAERENSMISQIEESTESDVIVYVAMPGEEQWANIKPIGLTENSAHWINSGVAQYYGKRSITLQYIE